MPEVSIDKKTCWECQRCGKCCHDIIMSKGISISRLKGDTPLCRFFDESAKLCGNYANRPFICRIYPFVMNTGAILGSDGIARPMNAFKLENMTIHTECPGYGKGKRVIANSSLLRHLGNLAHAFSLRMKEAHEKKIDSDEIM